MLLALLPRVPAGDPVLGEEMIRALARSRDPKGVETVAAYVRSAWDRTARGEHFREGVESWVDSTERFSKDHSPYSPLSFGDVDLEYRRTDIDAFLLEMAGAERVLAALCTDPSLHLFLRIHWIVETALYAEGSGRYEAPGSRRPLDHTAVLRIARKDLDREAVLHGGGSLEARVIALVKRYLDRVLDAARPPQSNSKP